MRDSDPEKWIYKEHTRVKHELLDKYLGGWLRILGSAHGRLVIVDGFAGRGIYPDGSESSPLVILQRAAEIVDAGWVGQVTCAFVEIDVENFRNLADILGSRGPQHSGVKVTGPYNDSFENIAEGLIDSAGDRFAPSFWFVDPFGFTGISFETVRRIMSLERSEVFVTLMLRDIGRFLGHADLEQAFDRLFGTREWLAIVESEAAGEEKEQALRDLYIAQLRSLGCKVTAFRVSMDEKAQTLYYMVHATRHCRGRWLMKDVMKRQGANGVFAYLGPGDLIARMQGSLFPVDTVRELMPEVMQKFRGRTVGFDSLLDECCDDNELGIPDYRRALQELRRQGKVQVRPVTSKTTRGLQGMDQITFP